MILFFQSFINTLKSLSWIDLVFLAAVIALIVLVVTLIYFIKINNEADNEVKEEYKKLKTDIIKEPLRVFDDPEEGELYDLQSISEQLEKRDEQAISLTDYEEEQEQRAIISYDELLEKSGNYKLNYEDEKKSGDVIIKKVDVDNIVASKPEIKEEEKVRVISYEKEEAFLNALKKLQEQIN